MQPVSTLCCTLLALVAAALGAWVCRRIAIGLPQPTIGSLQRRARHLYLAVPALLVMPGLSIYITANPSMHWDLPWVLQLHYVTLHWGIISSVLAYVFGFSCMASFLVRQRARWLVLGVAVLILAAIQGYAHFRYRTNRPELAAARTSHDGVILQSSSATCVPAAGANIAVLLGVPATEREMVERFQTTCDGTFPVQALVGLKQLGIKSGKLTIPDADLRKVRAPAMLFILGDTHAVTYVQLTNGMAEIWDPSSGKRLVPEGRVREFWQGHALECSR